MQKAIKKHRKRRTKNIVLFVAVVAVIAVAILASAMMLGLIGRSSRPKASEYLRVVHSRSLGEFAEADASPVHVKTLGIDITAVGGDANSILIDVDGLVPEGEGDYNYYESLTKGEKWSAALPLSNMYLDIEEGDEYYIFQVRVSVHEAESEIFTLHIYPDEILSSTQRKLTILPSTNGRTVISPSTSGYTTAENVSYWFDLNRNITLSAIPDSGFVFDYWIINSQNMTTLTTNPYTLTMTDVTTVEASFTPQP